LVQLIPRPNIPQVTAGGIPSVRNEARLDISGQQQAIQTLTQGAQDLTAKWQERNDTAALLKARRELSDWEVNTFSPANVEGVNKYRGGEALKAGADLTPKMDEQIGKIRESLTGTQRARFDAIAGQWRDGVSNRLNNHMDREHSQYIEREEVAAIDRVSQDAVLAGAAEDFARQDQVANEAIVMRQRQLASQGYAPDSEYSRAATREMASSIRAQTVAGLVSSKPLEAAAYLDKYREQMTPADRVRTQALVQPILDDVQADRDAAWAMQGGVDIPPADVAAVPRGAPPPAIAKILDEEAAAAGIPKEYLYALAEQESSFRADAVNPEVLDDGDQATGLFQYRKTSAGGIDRKDARASARRAAQEFKARMAKGGAQFAVAAHFAGEGGAEAVIQRGRTAENPKTTRYIREVEARAARWRGNGPAAVMPAAATEADALTRAQTITDPDRRARAMRKIREDWSIRDARENELKKQQAESAYTAIQQNPNQPLRQILGAEAYGRFEREGKIDALENIRKNAIERTFVQDDPVLAEAYFRESILSPNTFAKRNFYDADIANRLSTDTLRQLVARQADVAKPEKQAEWATEAQRIEMGWSQLGLAPNQDQKADKKTREQRRDAFAMRYRNAEKAYIQSSGQKPTPQQADALLQSVVQGVAADMSVLDAKLTMGPYAGAPAASSVDLAAGVLAPEMRREAVQSYQARYGASRTPSDADIIRYWQRKGMQ